VTAATYSPGKGRECSRELLLDWPVPRHEP
jgi:hypothetical protein